MHIFKDTGIMEQSAYFGWQDKDTALYGLREGYKKVQMIWLILRLAMEII